MIDPDAIKKVTAELTEKGLLIEAGWQGLQLALLQGCSDIQVREMRFAFFAGAQHLFASLMGGALDEGAEEPTPTDMNRMGNIHAELERFGKELKLRMAPAAGRRQ